jgi:hypothetical protein
MVSVIGGTSLKKASAFPEGAAGEIKAPKSIKNEK